MFNGYVQQFFGGAPDREGTIRQPAKFGAFVMVSELLYVYLVFLVLLFGVFLAGLVVSTPSLS